MSLLFETVRVVNGLPQHLEWHKARMNLARQEIWNLSIPIALESEINTPAEFSSGVVRCNIYYGPEIREISYKKYQKRIIRSLKLVTDYPGDYHLKYTDRSMLESYFALRGRCDDIIILKYGLITDTSISNIVFSV